MKHGQGCGRDTGDRAVLAAAADWLYDSRQKTYNTGMLNSDERELIQRCQRGNADAFNELFKRHHSRIFNYAFSLTRSQDDALDITQDAFLRAWNNIRSFRGDSSFVTWMTRITRNLFLDLQKKRKHDPRISLDEMMESQDSCPIREAPDESPGPEETILTQERVEVVRRAIVALAPEHREILTLYDIQSYSYDEIASILRLPMGTVKSRLNRARRALRDRLMPARELLDV